MFKPNQLIIIKICSAHKLVNIMDKNITHGDGLFSKMKSEKVPEEIIVRLFGDLMIAANDTVRNFEGFLSHFSNQLTSRQKTQQFGSSIIWPPAMSFKMP